MKNLGEIERKLKELKPTLRHKFKVESIRLFGSYVKRQQKAESDLDVLIEFSEQVGFFKFIKLKDFVGGELGTRVDLVIKNALRPRIGEEIIKEAIHL